MNMPSEDSRVADEEIIGLLMAISTVSKRMALKMMRRPKQVNQRKE